VPEIVEVESGQPERGADLCPLVLPDGFAQRTKRSSEIEAAMESSGFTSYRARNIAARATRAARPMSPVTPCWCAG
jgi:hypothetical protein